MIKKLLLTLLMTTIVTSINSQVKTPASSPFSKIEQKVGLTDVIIEYSRPGVKNRAIFGELVPYDEFWRTGANKNTIVTFSDDVVIDGKNLKKGSYAIFTKPNKNSWEIVFYSDTNNWGTPRKWDDSKVALKTTSKVKNTPIKVETFTISFDNITSNSAIIAFSWENTYVGLKLNTPTEKSVEASISEVMNGPSAGDYYSAAVYYFQNGKNINQAKDWINKAVELTKDEPRFWYLRQQSLILAKSGDKNGAIKAAKASLANAEKAGNTTYVKMNKEFINKTL